jgi:cytochrome c-type biogenesis protein
MHEITLSIKNILENSGYGPLGVAVALLLGIISALASACCTLPLIGAIAGYSIAQKSEQADKLRTGIFFMAGVIITILAIGCLFIFAGQTVQKISGDHWKIIVGSASILFGIGALELFPFKVPSLAIFSKNAIADSIAPWVAGLILGGAVTISSLPCNPGIYIILGAAVIQEHVVWAFLSLTGYAIGFSIPLSLIVFGLSAGKNLVRIKSAEKIVRITGGILLIAVGIYFFHSI